MKIFDIKHINWSKKSKSGVIRILKLSNAPAKHQYFDGLYLCLIEFRKVPIKGFPFGLSIGINNGYYIPIPTITLEIFVLGFGLDIYLFHEN